MNKTTKYGLRLKGKDKILGFYARSNDGRDFCVDTEITLCDIAENQWLVNEAEHAEYVRLHSTEWFNAGYETPSHNFEPEALEVVEVEINIKPITVKIPTWEELVRERYHNEPGHLKYLLESHKKHDKLCYNLYDLRDHLREKGKTK